MTFANINLSHFTTASTKLLHPIGCVYTSVSPTNPSVIFGGSWIAFGQGRVLVGFDDTQVEFNTSQKTGGSKTHQLTTSEMPTHVHGYTGQNGTGYPDGALDNITAGNSRSYPRQSEVDSEGGDQPHQNLQPYIVVHIFKRIA